MSQAKDYNCIGICNYKFPYIFSQLNVCFRFVNMIHQSKEDLETIWNTVKNIRKTYLHKHRVTEPDCLTQYYQGVFLTNHDVLKNNDKVEEGLSTNSSYDIYDNITEETFENAAKMFSITVLIDCSICTKSFLKIIQQRFYLL